MQHENENVQSWRSCTNKKPKGQNFFQCRPDCGCRTSIMYAAAAAALALGSHSTAHYIMHCSHPRNSASSIRSIDYVKLSSSRQQIHTAAGVSTTLQGDSTGMTTASEQWHGQ
jgi:hypothetical protein